MRRLFFAIPVPAPCKHLLRQAFAKKQGYGIRKMQEDQLHVTVHFLGNVDEGGLALIQKAMPALCEKHQPFLLYFSTYRIIFNGEKPVMIWSQGDDLLAFTNLCYDVRKLFPAGETRKPVPHITLARIRQRRALPFSLPKAIPFSIRADAIELWESHLKDTGAKYEVAGRWQFTD